MKQILDLLINLEIKYKMRTRPIFNLEIKKKRGSSIDLDIPILKFSELKTLDRGILNPDRLFNLGINNKRGRVLFNLEIKKKRRSSINLDIHHSKVFSSDYASRTFFIKFLENHIFINITRFCLHD